MSEIFKKKCYVIVQRGTTMGGIETMILRLAKTIVSNGDGLIVCGEPSPIAELLPKEVDFFLITRERDFLSRLPDYIKSQYRNSEIILVSLHPWSLVICYIMRYLLGRFRAKPARTFHLVTHSRAFFFSTNFPVVNKFLKAIFFSAPPASVFFMNDATRAAHAEEWKCDLSSYGVLKLPLAEIEAAWKPQESSHLRIVSVGRLVPFKAYNRTAPSIARRLQDSGITVTWDIWGDGGDRAFIEEEIKSHKISQSVILRGELPYQKFAEVIASYDVFVGMGTAILEAGQIGVPSVCAIDSDSDQCYGFIHEAPSDSVGDIVSGTDRLPIIDVLMQFHAMNITERAEIGRLSAVDANARAHGIKHFVDTLHTSPKWPARFDFGSLFLLLLSWILFSVREVRIARADRVVAE